MPPDAIRSFPAGSRPSTYSPMNVPTWPPGVFFAPGDAADYLRGGQRIHDPDLLAERIREHGPASRALPVVHRRKYGTFPHSGFGLGVEPRSWLLCGIKHIREDHSRQLLYKDLPLSKSPGRDRHLRLRRFLVDSEVMAGHLRSAGYVLCPGVPDPARATLSS